MTNDADYDRPDPMMDLLADHTIRAARVTRLPNRRALAVLDQMFAYHDQTPAVEKADLTYDHAA